MGGDLSIEGVMKVIDVYGRLAFGGQCVAAMGMIAGPLPLITCAILPFALWGDDRGEALLVWLGGWALAIGVTVGAIAFAVFCWRWSGDWITEWPGYATCFSIAAIACAALAYMLTSTPVPVYVSIAATMAAAFASGFLVAGHLGGTQVLSETRQQRRVVTRRR
jgi:hypothetical protein